MDIVSYEYKTTRAARVMWVIDELGLDVSRVDAAGLIRSDELKKFHPQGKLPVIIDHGRPLFESVAIVNWLADAYGPEGFIPKSGTWARAIYEQWTSFTLTEVEAHLWSIARNTFVYPKEKRSEEVKRQAAYELGLSLKVLENELSTEHFMNKSHFSALDINVAYTLNWAQMIGKLNDYENLNAYLSRMKLRTHCPF